jgi:hypothetical protein
MQTQMYLMIAFMTLAVLIAIGFIVYLVRRSWSARAGKVVPARGSRDRFAYTPRCAKCGRDMRPGWIVASRGIIWRSDEQGLSNLAPVWDSLANTVNWGFGARGVRAWRCRECDTVFFDHSVQVKNV